METIETRKEKYRIILRQKNYKKEETQTKGKI